jgi:hypothetical protein
VSGDTVSGANTPERRVPRRGVLIAGGGLLASGLAVACTGGSASKPVTTTTSPSPTPTPTSTTAVGAPQRPGDLAVAALAASLENTLGGAYASVLDLVSGDKLGPLPTSVTTLVQTMQSHHRDHAAAWNAILTAAGDTAVTGADTSLFTAVIGPSLPTLKTLHDLVGFALQIERIAAATYLDAVQHALATTGAIQTAAAIQPVEMQHVAILGLLAGSSPVPDSFATSVGARTTADALG